MRRLISPTPTTNAMNTAATKAKPRGIKPAASTPAKRGNSPQTIRFDARTRQRLEQVKLRWSLCPSVIVRLGVTSLLDSLDRGEPLPLPALTAAAADPSNN